MKLLRGITIAGFLLVGWQLLVWATGVPAFILPDPLSVGEAILSRPTILAYHAAYTITEILLGLLFGVVIGSASALLISSFQPVRRWLLPLLVISSPKPC